LAELDGQRRDQLLGRHDALALDVLARDDLDGQGALVLDALDARPSDLHAFELATAFALRQHDPGMRRQAENRELPHQTIQLHQRLLRASLL
jgi:hypothetical protein